MHLLPGFHGGRQFLFETVEFRRAALAVRVWCVYLVHPGVVQLLAAPLRLRDWAVTAVADHLQQFILVIWPKSRHRIWDKGLFSGVHANRRSRTPICTFGHNSHCMQRTCNEELTELAHPKQKQPCAFFKKSTQNSAYSTLHA